MTWTAKRSEEHCGACQVAIPERMPIAVLCGRLLRCASCAGDAVDQAQYLDALQHLDRLDASDRERSETAPMRLSAQRPSEQRALRLSTTDPSKGRGPTPFFQLPAKDRRRHNAIAGNR